ncbi:aldose epimerase family protein [Terriglobus tenax]|uniref:aldose epimerase family protein n=1 Tax=Terriglobus tenax TaxID=1111115 RepID=UPI0021DF6F6C|nr:aldose epimerase family protein [Terriglobus tenax]
MSETVVTKAVFGRLPDGGEVEIFTMKNDVAEARVMSWGARLVSLKTKDREGVLADISLGYDKLEEWLVDRPHFGSTIGRFGNRIALGKFTLDGVEYQLPINNGPNSLHGGPLGFDKLPWTAKQVPDGVELTLVSPDGDAGYPGTLTVKTTYTLVGSELRLKYHAVTDKATILNLTNHSYFNLRGDDRGDVADTVVTIYADKYLPTDEGQIPTGEVASVEGTPMDLRSPQVVSKLWDDTSFEPLRIGEGFDHMWIVNGEPGTMRPMAEAYLPETGRVLTVKSTEPGMQFYTGNHLTGAFTGRHGQVYAVRTGFCFETQGYPDAPNHANFPSTVLRPGEVFASETVYGFGVR